MIVYAECQTGRRRDACEVGRPMNPKSLGRDWTFRHKWKNGVCTQCDKTREQVLEPAKVRPLKSRPASQRGGK